jgi:hypothetical protein
LLFAVAPLIVVVALPARAEAATAITWRVENPFRFFTDPSDTEVHRATYRALGAAGRAAPVLAEERALQDRQQPYGWAATMFRKTCWSNNRFQCDAYDDYINPSSHAVVAKISGVDDAKMLTCTWLTAPRNAQEPRGEAVTQPCNESVRFVVPYPSGSLITVQIGGIEVARVDMKVRDILVAGMGDSFASGEGNPDVAVRFSRERSANYSSIGTLGLYNDLTGYPARLGPWRMLGDKTFIKENARWLDQACHRSLYSEQMRTALQLAIEDPHRAVTFVGVACAGAEVTDGLFLRYKGNEWVPNPPRLSQLSAVAEAQCGKHPTDPADLPDVYQINGEVPQLSGSVMQKCPEDEARKIDLVLLSIGGNDIGFSRLLANAVLSNESLLRELGGWLGDVHGEAEASAQLSHLDARYKSLDRALHNLLYVPWEESDRIVLVSYPGLALDGDGSETCKDGHAGMEAVPDFELSETKLKLGTWFADKLHRQMRDSANAYGWTFVETHRRAFIGRSICAGLSVEGVSEVDDLRLPRKIDGKWVPYNPADYLPYASRQRWFRTPNDAFMTGNFHAAAGLLTKFLKLEPFAPFQLVLASTYSGAFHPTAEGQAAIADAVVDKARAVLAKYGEGPDPTPLGYTVPDDVPPPPVAEPDRQIPDVAAALKAAREAAAKNAASAGPASPAAAPDDDTDDGSDSDARPAIATTPVVGGAPPDETTPSAGVSPQDVTTPAVGNTPSGVATSSTTANSATPAGEAPWRGTTVLPGSDAPPIGATAPTAGDRKTPPSPLPSPAAAAASSANASQSDTPPAFATTTTTEPVAASPTTAPASATAVPGTATSSAPASGSEASEPATTVKPFAKATEAPAGGDVR